MGNKKKDNQQLPLFNVRMPPQKVVTQNEAIALMHKERANAFRLVAEYIIKHRLSPEEVYELLTSTADEAEAQSMVVELRDKL